MLSRKLLMVILFYGLFPYETFGIEEKDCPRVESLARTLIFMELHGRRNPKYHHCLKHMKSSSILIRPEQNDEALNRPPEVSFRVSDESMIKIENIKKTDISERYVVKFSYLVEGQTIYDQLTIETYQGTMMKMVGCAAISTPPKHHAILEKCHER